MGRHNNRFAVSPHPLENLSTNTRIMKTADKLFTELREKELTRPQVLELGWALKELAEAMTERSAWDTLRHVSQAERYITEFRGNLIPVPELTKAEANLSASLHTYMRKGMDSHLSIMLYRMVSENRGIAVWYGFVKGLAANKNDFRDAINAADAVYHGTDTTDNLLMLQALWMWEDDFKYALDWLKGT